MPAVHRVWHTYERDVLADRGTHVSAKDSDGAVLVSFDELPAYHDRTCVLCKFAQDELLPESVAVVPLVAHGVHHPDRTLVLSRPLGHARGRSPPTA